MASIIFDSILQKWRTLPMTTVDLQGRVVVITGANIGIGFEAASAFYKMNPARLIIACRNMEKGERARADILKTVKEEGASYVYSYLFSDAI
jgi:retinol dehydrogenase 12